LGRLGLVDRPRRDHRRGHRVERLCALVPSRTGSWLAAHQLSLKAAAMRNGTGVGRDAVTSDGELRILEWRSG
jgi:hypothetical protein